MSPSSCWLGMSVNPVTSRCTRPNSWSVPTSSGNPACDAGTCEDSEAVSSATSLGVPDGVPSRMPRLPPRMTPPRPRLPTAPVPTASRGGHHQDRPGPAGHVQARHHLHRAVDVLRGDRPPRRDRTDPELVDQRHRRRRLGAGLRRPGRGGRVDSRRHGVGGEQVSRGALRRGADRDRRRGELLPVGGTAAGHQRCREQQSGPPSSRPHGELCWTPVGSAGGAVSSAGPDGASSSSEFPSSEFATVDGSLVTSCAVGTDASSVGV